MTKPKKRAQEPVAAEGVWLRTSGDHVELLVEVDRAWRVIQRHRRTDFTNGEVSHITEPLGIRQGKPDPLTQGASS